MADNFVTNAGSGGDTFGADDIGGVKFPRTKLIVGADGTNDGDVSSANPLPVSGTVDLGATDNAVLDSIAALLTTIDADTGSLAGAVSGSEMQVDVLTMPTVTVTGTVGVSGAVEIANDAGNPIPVNGTVTANLGSIGDVATQTTLAAINAKITACNTAGVVVSSSALPSGAATEATLSTLSGKITACNTGAVTVSGALPAGTNAIGKLAANSGVDIGDVDVTSIAAGTNTIGGVISQTSTSAAYDGTTSCTIKRLSGIATASGANTLLAAVVGKKFRVLALSLLATSTTAVGAYVYNGDYMLLGDGTNKLTLDMDGVGGPAGLVLPFNQGGWFETDTANEALALNLGAATPVIWCVTYVEVA